MEACFRHERIQSGVWFRSVVKEISALSIICHYYYGNHDTYMATKHDDTKVPVMFKFLVEHMQCVPSRVLQELTSLFRYSNDAKLFSVLTREDSEDILVSYRTC